MRSDAGAFDVSHMGQLHVEGPTTEAFLQSLLSNDLDRLADGEAQYTLLTNERGGIVDDLIVYRIGPVPLPARRQRGQPRGRIRVAQGARAARHRGARRLRGVRAPRRAGAALARPARGSPRRLPFTHAMGEVRRHRGDGLPHGVHRRAGRRADVPCGGRRGALGRGRRARGQPVRARRARHAPARGLLPAARQRHHAGDGCDLGRPRLDVRARQGLHRRGRAPPDQGRGARAAARRVRDGGEGGAAPGDGDRGRGRGHLGHALSVARRRHRDGLRPDRPGRPGHRARPRRPRQAAPRPRRHQADLPEGACSEHRELSGRPPVPPRARLGPGRRRGGRARDHVVRPGRARRARPLRGTRGRRAPSRRTRRTPRSSRSRRSRT